MPCQKGIFSLQLSPYSGAIKVLLRRYQDAIKVPDVRAVQDIGLKHVSQLRF